MTASTNLELAAPRAIFLETPDWAAGLELQSKRATVLKRENVDCGFFTYIAVSSEVPNVGSPGTLYCINAARVHGIEHGLWFVLFADEGRIHMLEGYTFDPKSTALLDLFNLTFEISNEAIYYMSRPNASQFRKFLPRFA